MANKYLPNRYSYFLHFEVLKSGNRPFPPSHCLRLGPDPRIFQRSKKTRFPFSLQIKPIRSRAGFQGQVNGLVTVKLAQQLQERRCHTRVQITGRLCIQFMGLKSTFVVGDVGRIREVVRWCVCLKTCIVNILKLLKDWSEGFSVYCDQCDQIGQLIGLWATF